MPDISSIGEPSAFCRLLTLPETAAAQEEMGAIMQTGAAVASIRKASLAREILWLSVTGLITEPTVRQLK